MKVSRRSKSLYLRKYVPKWITLNSKRETPYRNCSLGTISVWRLPFRVQGDPFRNVLPQIQGSGSPVHLPRRVMNHAPVVLFLNISWSCKKEIQVTSTRHLAKNKYYVEPLWQ